MADPTTQVSAHAVRDAWDYFALLAPIITTAFVSWIAFMQWRLAKVTIRLNLYNRRFAAYRAAIEFLSGYLGFDLQKENLDKKHAEFIIVALEAKYLFSDKSELPNLFQDLRKLVAERDGINTYLDKLRTEDPAYYVEKSERAVSIYMEINVKMEHLTEKMRLYLDFGQL